MELKKESLLCLSTAHITEKGALILAEHPDDCSIYEEGFFINTVYVDHIYFRKIGMSETFIALCDIAHKEGCKFIQFDRDGEEYEFFKTFNW